MTEICIAKGSGKASPGRARQGFPGPLGTPKTCKEKLALKRGSASQQIGPGVTDHNIGKPESIVICDTTANLLRCETPLQN